MSTVKVNAIRSTSGSSDAITLNSSSGVTAINGNPLRAQNLVINGAMEIAQRGTSSTTKGKSTVDMFRTHQEGEDEDCTQAQVALTSSDTGPWEKGLRHAFQITNGNQTSGAGAGDFHEIETRLEAQNVANSGWNYTSASSYVTLSFWVKASVAQNYYGYVRTVDGTGQIYSFETGALTADTWTKVTKTIPGHANLQIDSNNEQGLKIFFTQYTGTDRTSSLTLNAWAAYGSGNDKTPDQPTGWWTTNDATYAITGVQLEVGPTASEYMHESYGETLAKCQRYYYDHLGGFPEDDTAYGVGTVYNAGYVFSYIPFRVQMRAKPTLETNDNANSHNVLIGATSHGSNKNFLSSAGTSSALIYPNVGTISVTAAQCGILRASSTTNCKLRFSAEL